MKFLIFLWCSISYATEYTNIRIQVTNPDGEEKTYRFSVEEAKKEKKIPLSAAAECIVGTDTSKAKGVELVAVSIVCQDPKSKSSNFHVESRFVCDDDLAPVLIIKQGKPGISYNNLPRTLISTTCE